MKLIYRPRLGMSVGKLIAQLGHGIGLYQIGLFQNKAEAVEADVKANFFSKLAESGSLGFDIVKFESDSSLELEESEFKGKFKHVVVDAGLTVFNGIKTATVAVEFENSESIAERNKEYSEDIKSKMVVLIKKSFSKKSSEDLLIMAGVAAVADSCQKLIDQLECGCFDENQKNLANSWLFGRFAKVVRVLDDSDFRKASEFIKSNSKFSDFYSKDGEDVVIVLSPVESNDYSQVKELKGRLL